MAQFNAPQGGIGNPLYDALGSALGAALGGLGNYAYQQHRAPELEKQFQSWGATPDQAKFLARQPPQQQQQWINQQQKQQAIETKNRGIADVYAGRIPNTEPNNNPIDQQNAIPTAEPNVNAQTTEDVGAKKIDKKLDAEIRQATKKMDYDAKERLLRSGLLTQQEADSLRRQMESQRANDIAEDKFAHAKDEALLKHHEVAYKMTEPFRAEAFKEEENAAHMQDVINEQLQLSKSGEMDNHGFIEFLERFNLDLNALKNPKTEQFQSLEKEYLKDLKSIFGGKISNDEMKAFLKGIPKATNSPEARNAMLERWKSYYEAKGLKAKLIREITKANHGVPPYNLRDQVAERLNAEQEKLANKFLGIPEGSKLLLDQKTGQRAYIDKNGKVFELD